MFQFRQQHADTFLASLESVCSERAPRGRLAWAPDCVAPMLEDFLRNEHALGALLTYRERRLRRGGERVDHVRPAPGALADIVRRPNGDVTYSMYAERADLALTTRFGADTVEPLFASVSTFGRAAEVFLLDSEGRFLASSNRDAGTPATQAGLASRCRGGASRFVDVDFTGAKSFQSLQPVAVLGAACAGARLGYDAVLAPALQLRDDLIRRVAWFVLGGVALSLIAAHWISAPIRHLAASARRLQHGQFGHPIPLGGPSEVRGLGRAFAAMSSTLEELVAREHSARIEAERASQAKDDFLATVSHELRTPLTAVLGWARMLRRHDAPQSDVHHGLEIIERSAVAQARLIDDLLDVSRIVSSRLRMNRDAVSLAHIVETAIEQVRPQAQVKQVDLSVDLRDSGIVLGDARRLEQVVSNLLWNAIKFTDSPGRVSVFLERVGREMVLTVSDSGVGIPPAFLPHVFDWFRQADARSRSQSGLGLGLGIVRHIVRLHHGTVRAESAGEGHGATFTVTLPILQPAPAGAGPLPESAPTPVPAPAPIAHQLEAIRVLVVEDDEDARQLVRLTLERAGASVDAVASAGEARREISGVAPHVLISDIRMPEEDGYSLIRSLRSAGIATPAIALTAYARQEDADEARAAGFQLHLAKPIDESRLVDAVASLVHQ